MIQIEQILVTKHPSSPLRGHFELTIDEVHEFGESFFKPGFIAKVWLTDGSYYSFIRTKKGWEYYEMIDEGLGNISEYPGTFEESLGRLLTEVNIRSSKNQ
jgi:hypothetical protein